MANWFQSYPKNKQQQQPQQLIKHEIRDNISINFVWLEKAASLTGRFHTAVRKAIN